MKDFKKFVDKKGGPSQVSKDTGIHRNVIYEIQDQKNLDKKAVKHYAALQETYPEEDFREYFSFLKSFGKGK